MNVIQVQTVLAQQGRGCAVDGALGPQTYAALLDFAAARSLGEMGQALGRAMADTLAAHAIASDLQLIHWIAQSCHETEGYQFLTELGDDHYFARYDGRADLGNTRPGDGYAFRGRGLFQITGRWNYAHFGAAIGEPLEMEPDRAAHPDVAVRIACQFWVERRIGPLADADDLVAVTRHINGGLVGLERRAALTRRLKQIFGA